MSRAIVGTLVLWLLAAGSATRAADLVLTVKPDAGRVTAFTSGGC